MAQKMGDFARPTFTATTSAIVLTTEVRNYELKPHHLALLPTYYGLPNEDALTFIREYCTMVQNFPLGELSEDDLKMKCFQYTLKDRAKSWYLTLPANSLTTWNAVCEKFMMKYYPNRKTQEVRSQIMNFAQGADEPFHEAWERFQELLQQCPHHQMASEMLWQYFYDSLNQTCQFMVDSSAGGNIGVKTADELRMIFETLAASSQQKSSRPRKMEASVVTISPDLTKQLADMMRDLQELKMKTRLTPSEPCGMCGLVGHDIDECTRKAELTYEGGAEVYAAQGYPPPPYAQQFPHQQPFYPPQQSYYPPPPQFYPPPPQQSPLDEATFAAFMNESKLAREAQDATIRRLETAIGQIFGAVNELKKLQNVKPSQPKQAHALTVIEEEQDKGKKWRSHTVAAIKASRQRSHASPTSAGHLSSLPKQGDPGSFKLDVVLDNGDSVPGMLDLGAAVNLMPYSIFERMGSRDLKPTNFCIELADGSLSRPLGIVEDVALLVRGIRVLADFVVLDVGRGARSERGHLLLLGRPFMATTQTRIDVGSGTLSMAGVGGSVTFSIFDNYSSYPNSFIQTCSYVHITNDLDEKKVEENFQVAIHEEEAIIDEFLSKLDEEEIVEEFLSNVQGMEDHNSHMEESVLSLQQEEEIMDNFLANLDEETLFVEDPSSSFEDRDISYMDFHTSVGEMSVQDNPLFEFQAEEKEESTFAPRVTYGWLKTLLVATDFG